MTARRKRSFGATWNFSLHVPTLTSVPQMTSLWPAFCSLATATSPEGWKSQNAKSKILQKHGVIVERYESETLFYTFTESPRSDPPARSSGPPAAPSWQIPGRLFDEPESRGWACRKSAESSCPVRSVGLSYTSAHVNKRKRPSRFSLTRYNRGTREWRYLRGGAQGWRRERCPEGRGSACPCQGRWAWAVTLLLKTPGIHGLVGSEGHR